MPKKNVKYLLHFRMDIAENLIRVGKSLTPKRKGQPRSSGDKDKPTSKAAKIDSTRQSDDVCFDQVDHLPGFDDKNFPSICKNRCRIVGKLTCFASSVMFILKP